jgi:hypothetical protein
LIYIKRKANNRGAEVLKKFTSTSRPAVPQGHTAVSGLGSSIIDPNHGSSQFHDVSSAVPYNHEALSKLLPEELINETDSVFHELEHQKLMREEFEKRMEEKLSKVEGENQILKQLFLDSRKKNLLLQERMERVLQTLYAVFMNGQAGKALAGRMPVRIPFLLFVFIRN